MSARQTKAELLVELEVANKRAEKAELELALTSAIWPRSARLRIADIIERSECYCVKRCTRCGAEPSAMHELQCGGQSTISGDPWRVVKCRKHQIIEALELHRP